MAVSFVFGLIDITGSWAQRGSGRGGGGTGEGGCVMYDGKCRPPAWIKRREKCAAMVQANSFPSAGNTPKGQFGRMAVQRCMRAGPGYKPS